MHRILCFLLIGVVLCPANAQAQTETKITAQHVPVLNEFGAAVALSGDVLVVGARTDDEIGEDMGAAYFYLRQGSDWIQTNKFLPPSDVNNYAGFGESVALNDDLALVGAPSISRDGVRSGAVFAFQRQGIEWIPAGVLTPSDAEPDDRFGGSVAVSGDYALVGDRGDAAQQGAAYVFRLQNGAWVQTSKLTANDGAAGDLFGASVALSGDYALVGATGEDDTGRYTSVAYVFQRQEDAWVQTSTLTPDGPGGYVEYGVTVAIDGDLAVLGFPFAESYGSNTGAAYVFQRQGDAWVQVTNLSHVDLKENDQFGVAVAVRGPTVMVGTRGDRERGEASGAVYVFRLEGSDWTRTQKLFPDAGSEHYAFGTSVALGDGEVLVGAPGDYASTVGAAFFSRKRRGPGLTGFVRGMRPTINSSAHRSPSAATTPS